MEEYDAYYLDRRGERPLPVIYARMNDAVSTRYYIDPRTARVVGNYSAARLGEPLAVSRAAFARFPLAVQVPAAMGHRGDPADAGRNGVVRHLASS